MPKPFKPDGYRCQFCGSTPPPGADAPIRLDLLYSLARILTRAIGRAEAAGDRASLAAMLVLRQAISDAARDSER